MAYKLDSVKRVSSTLRYVLNCTRFSCNNLLKGTMARKIKEPYYNENQTDINAIFLRFDLHVKLVITHDGALSFF
jgi:hypothetical protein